MVHKIKNNLTGMIYRGGRAKFKQEVAKNVPHILDSNQNKSKVKHFARAYSFLTFPFFGSVTVGGYMVN